MPEESRAEAVIDAFKLAGDLPDQRVLLPRADIAREVIADELRAAHAEVTEVIAYRTAARRRRARRRPRRLPDAARSSDRRRHLHERVNGPELRPDLRSRAGGRSAGVDGRRVDRSGDRRGRAAARHRDARHAEALHDSRIWSTRSSSTSRASAEPAMSTDPTPRPPGPSSISDAGLAACAAPRQCARWCAKRGCRRTTFSIRCSCAAAKASGTKSRRCRACIQLSVDEVVKEAAAAKAEGIPGVLLFGLPDTKDFAGSAAYDPEAPVQSAIRALKRECPDLLVVTDVCLCEYTSHGHCGILVDDEVDNDAHGRGAGPRGAVARRSRRRHRRAVRHDGRPRRSHPRRARRRRLQPDRHPFLRGEVLLGVLRSVSRSRRLGARVRRSALPPDGPGQHRRSAARGAARSRRRGRHHHGEAGAALPRRHLAGEGRRSASRRPRIT